MACSKSAFLTPRSCVTGESKSMAIDGVSSQNNVFQHSPQNGLRSCPTGCGAPSHLAPQFAVGLFPPRDLAVVLARQPRLIGRPASIAGTLKPEKSQPFTAFGP